MDDNYSVNMVKKAAFNDEIRNYLDIIIKTAQESNEADTAQRALIVKSYLESRIKVLTEISK